MTDEFKLSATEVGQAVDRLAEAIAERHDSTQNLFLAGIAEGGVGMARRLAAKVGEFLGREVPAGVIDVSFHRDDIGSNPIPEVGAPTNLPPEVEGSTCILIDDVIFSGRTIRAALNELFDQGRPERVELAVLVDRGHRRLPFAVDYEGLVLETKPDQNVEVCVGENESAVDHVTVTTA